MTTTTTPRLTFRTLQPGWAQVYGTGTSGRRTYLGTVVFRRDGWAVGVEDQLRLDDSGLDVARRFARRADAAQHLFDANLAQARKRLGLAQKRLADLGA